MFDIIREKVDLKEVVSRYTQSDLKKAGDAWFQLVDDGCPLPGCGHKDCFKIHDTGSGDASYHCFSCGGHGDVSKFVALMENISDYEAMKRLAKEFKVQIPSDYSPVQEIFNLAATYYHTCLVEDAVEYPELSGLTPMQYQEQVRKHSKEALMHFQVGWSDGGLVDYLEALGISEQLIAESGLMGKNKRFKDFLPEKTFIYPHFVRGRVSHFTFKDPLKVKQFQLPNKNKLNNIMFKGQDTLKTAKQVIVVEGENDEISVWESGWRGGLLATIGSLSAAQLEWMTEHLADKEIITVFDPDDAGKKYQEKTWSARQKFKGGLKQITPPDDKDIDDYLKSGGSLENALKCEAVDPKAAQRSSVEVDAGEDDGSIIEKDGCYYKVRWKDGQPITIKLTGFTIRLRNIFIQGDRREREVVLIREDGKKSRPVTVTSEVKVSLKAFKSLAANAVDASFYGREEDLALLWDYVYKHSNEREVHLPTTVGRLPEFKGWMFRDCYVSDDGSVIEPDKEGVIWLTGGGAGIKPVSLDTEAVNKDDRLDIPQLIHDLDQDSRAELQEGFIQNLARNLGDVGMAIAMVAWAKANVYSDAIFYKYKCFPFLFFWGRHGQGKTIIGKWLLSLFGTDEPGYITVAQIKSGVGVARKMAYYASLPMMVDEVRSDRESVDLYGTFRGWYNRAGRTMGVKESFGVKVQDVRSNFLFSGQDQFTDSALRQRCIPLRIPVNNRETDKSYRWIEGHKSDLSSIGFDWILESGKVDVPEMIRGIEALNKELRNSGCDQRTSINWAVVGVIGMALAGKYFPGFDFNAYLKSACQSDTIEQQNDDMVVQFFGTVEGLQVGENAKVTADHILREGNKLYVWFAEVCRQVDAVSRGAKEEFSKKAILEALREEDYFLGEDRKELGLHPVRRRVIVLDLDKAPFSIQNIGNFYIQN
jgi:hypothetical protein